MTTAELPRTPFQTGGTAEAKDQQLVAAAVGGDQAALEALINRHHPWIYNLALRMVMVPADAEDVTQEVLVKILTKLGSYDPEKGAFRTWLYRVVTNHVLNMKARGYEEAITDFDAYYSFVDRVPDQEPEDTPETALIAEDLKIGCVMGTLLCLDRTQRLTFILAVAFGATVLVLMATGPQAERSPQCVEGRLPEEPLQSSWQAAAIHERQLRVGESRGSLPMSEEGEGIRGFGCLLCRFPPLPGSG